MEGSVMVQQWCTAGNLGVDHSGHDDLMIATGQHLLDLASGPGDRALELRLCGPALPVVLVEGSRSALGAAQGEVPLVVGQHAQSESPLLAHLAEDRGIVMEGEHEQGRLQGQ